MRRPFQHVWIAFAILILLWAAAGCGGAQKKEEFKLPGSTKLRLTSFQIQGTEAFSPDEIKEGLATRVDPGWRASPVISWFPILGAEHIYFNFIEWERDLQRLMTFYRARGYFNAKIISENIVQRREEGTVQVTLRIKEGEPTKIRSIEIDGLGDTGLEETSLIESLDIAEGDVFRQSDYLNAKVALEKRLRGKSYAYAQVKGRVVVDPDEQWAEVFFFSDPGPPSEFGDVQVSGLETVDEDDLMLAVTIEEGEPYDPEKVETTQENIYDLGVFSLVQVTPAHEAVEFEPEVGGDAPPGSADVGEVVGPGEAPSDEGGALPIEEQSAETGPLGISDLLNQAQEAAEVRTELSPIVPVKIELKEARLWNVRVGTAVAVETARQEVAARADWTSRNFLGGLRKLEHFNKAGYAWAPSFFSAADQRNEGVIVDSELRFTQPQFIERMTRLQIQLGFERAVEEGFIQTSPTAKIALRRQFFRRLTAEVSYNFVYSSLTNINESLLDPTVRLQSDYILEYFEQRLLLDFTNSFLNPTDGWLIELSLQEASEYLGKISPFGGGFDYLKPNINAEVYFPFHLFDFEILALRSRVASIYNTGRPKDPPVPQRLYSGGADSMRAFGRDRLSLFTRSGENAIPVGGLTKFEASVEQRFRLVRRMLDVGDLWGALFLDSGTVLGGQFLFDTASNVRDVEQFGDLSETLQYGAGFGAWWLTPIGPVRADFAYRLSSIENDPRFRRCINDQATCGPSEFVPVDEDPIQERISRFNFYIGIGHSF